MVNRNEPVGCKASTEVGNVEPLGLVCRWKKNNKNEPERGRLRGTLGGRYNQARRKGFKRERPVGCVGKSWLEDRKTDVLYVID